MQVSMIQFVKSNTDSGEEQAAEGLKPGFELITTGKAFVNIPGQTAPLAEHKKAAEEAFELALQRISSGYWDIVILDEINVAIDLGLIEQERLLDHLRNKPEMLHVILTRTKRSS